MFRHRQQICLLILSRTVPLIALLIVHSTIIIDAQIVSHELRRLAIATNQFGLDTLKALDRIEPPEKVLVFCPVCLSSSLMMIMMGSSKYPVVSAYRHALYVYSMKPQEINRGFKDIFEHIGMNQQQTSKSTKGAKSVNSSELNSSESTITRQDRHVSANQDDLFELTRGIAGQYLSLPKLMRLREFLNGRIEQNTEPWWLSISKKSMTNNSRELKDIIQHEAGGRSELTLNQPTNQTTDRQRDTVQTVTDMSQMSATSNIYIQRGLTMNYNYNLLLRQNYKTVIHPVDFVRNAEETRQHINSIVSANTEGKIKDLVRREAFTSSLHPRIMIISTFHFRGTLDIQMKNNKINTGKKWKSLRDLHRTSRNMEQSKNTSSSPAKAKDQLFIETEETLLKFGNFSSLDCSVVEIPFNNRLISLVVIMPNHLSSTELLLTKLSGQILNDIVNSLVVKKISIEIPVIKFDRGPINVEGLLKELGLDSTFYGDKMHSSETGLNKWMRPSDVVHETSIDIGTINPNWSQTEDRLKVGAHDSRSWDKRQQVSNDNHIKLDKPFFYFVLDSINGLVLTMGRIRQ